MASVLAVVSGDVMEKKGFIVFGEGGEWEDGCEVGG